LYKHDIIWKKITSDLGWQYIGTCWTTSPNKNIRM
jgi:hypothetical protein